MRFAMGLAGALTAVVLTAGSAAAMDAKIYPYATHENYCPAGLQPISISGVICCGVPNQSVSYQHVMMTGHVRAHKPRRHVVTYDCRPGEKGCS